VVEKAVFPWIFRDLSNYRVSTPAFWRQPSRLKLPVSDVSKTEGRIQKTGFRNCPKPKASETGSWQKGFRAGKQGVRIR
jgi:hypothetical protein